jgi:hypothetical protein
MSHAAPSSADQISKGLLFFFIMLRKCSSPKPFFSSAYSDHLLVFSAASLVVFLAAPIAMVDLLEQ